MHARVRRVANHPSLVGGSVPLAGALGRQCLRLVLLWRTATCRANCLITVSNHKRHSHWRPKAAASGTDLSQWSPFKRAGLFDRRLHLGDPLADEGRCLFRNETPRQLGHHHAGLGRFEAVDDDRFFGLAGHNVVLVVARPVAGGDGRFVDADFRRIVLAQPQVEAGRAGRAARVVAVMQLTSSQTRARCSTEPVVGSSKRAAREACDASARLLSMPACVQWAS